MRIEIFRGKDFLYYFRFVSVNGQILATSGDGYTSKANCIHSLNIVKKCAPYAIVYEK